MSERNSRPRRWYEDAGGHVALATTARYPESGLTAGAERMLDLARRRRSHASPAVLSPSPCHPYWGMEVMVELTPPPGMHIFHVMQVRQKHLDRMGKDPR